MTILQEIWKYEKHYPKPDLTYHNYSHFGIFLPALCVSVCVCVCVCVCLIYIVIIPSLYHESSLLIINSKHFSKSLLSLHN